MTLALLACGPNAIDSDQTMDLDPTLLSEIDQILDDLSFEFGRRPGMSEAALAAADGELDCRLPQPVRQLYAWHNGAEELIPAFAMLPFDEMLRVRREMTELLDGVGAGIRWPAHMLPIFYFDGSWMLSVDCSSAAAPVFSYDVEDGEFRPYSVSLRQMLDITRAALISGAYSIEDGSFVENEILMFQVATPFLTSKQISEREERWERGVSQFERFGSVQAFAGNPDPRAIPYYAAAFESDDPEEITTALFWFAEFGQRQALPRYLEFVASSDPIIRNMALFGLEKLAEPGDTHLMRYVSPALHDPDHLVRLSAIEVSAKIASPSSFDEMVPLLSGPVSGQTARVVDALRRIGDSRAIPPLCKLRHEINQLDFDQPYRGGTRGADLHPRQMLDYVDRALKELSGNCND